MTIKARLYIILTVMAVALIAVQAGAYYALMRTEKSMHSMYVDRVVPLRDLKLIADAYAVYVVDASHKARAQSFSNAEAIKSIREAEAVIAKSWTDYNATKLTDEEAKLVAEANVQMKTADASILNVLQILESGDRVALIDYVENRMYPQIEPVGESISKLIELQLRVAAEVNKAAEAEADMFNLIQLGVLLAIVPVLLMAISTARSRIAAPLARMTTAMMAVAEGRSNTVTPCLGQKDEMGQLADALEVFKHNRAEADRLAALQEHEQRRKAERQAALDSAISDFDMQAKQSVSILAGAATELNASAATLTGTAGSMTTQANEVALSSGTMASNIQTVAAAVTEMNASVDEISRNLSRSTETTNRAVSDAGEANVKVQGLAEAARRIGDVVTLISEIASQTNLLALNATIEAARAGEAGKGFAVVASEVKNLASQTAKATEEITGQINAIQDATQGAVSAIEQITRVISEIDQITSGISAAVEEQSAVTRDIAENVNQAAQAAQTVNQSVGEVSTAANDVGSSAQEVESAASDVGRQSSSLKDQVDAFFQRVRAA